MGGTGFRTPNVLMEELGVWASNRAWVIEDSLRPEQGWNVGLNVTSKFKLFYRDADLAIDGYWTEFQNSAVVDSMPMPTKCDLQPRRREPRVR